MSVIILGGNECMERQYKDLCKEYKCRAKVFIKRDLYFWLHSEPKVHILTSSTKSIILLFFSTWQDNSSTRTTTFEFGLNIFNEIKEINSCS